MDSKAKFELRRLDAGEIPVALHTRLPLAMLYAYRCLSSPSLFPPSFYNRDFYIMELPSTELQYVMLIYVLDQQLPTCRCRMASLLLASLSRTGKGAQCRARLQQVE